MRLTMKTILRTCSLLALLMFSFSCEDSFLDQEVPHRVSADDLYVDETGFEIGLNGLYALARTERSGITSNNNPTGSSNNLMSSMMMGGTDLIYANRPWNAERFLNDWGAQVVGGDAAIYFREVWEWLYETINAANTIITRGEDFVEDIPSDQQDELATFNRILAEARTIRAWAYRHLTFLWGDVPMPLEESTGLNFRVDWQRISITDVRAQMKQDLEFGVIHLPQNHIDDGKIVRAVAQHYLTELLIIEGDFDEAINTALAAINGPKQLVTARYGENEGDAGTPFTDMFLDGNSNPSQGNTEALWVFQNGFEIEGGQGHNIMRRWLMSEYSSTSGGSPGLEVTVERGGRGQTRLSASTFMLDLYGARDVSNNLLVNDDRGGEFAWRTSFTIGEGDPSSAGAVGSDIFLDFSSIDPLGDRFRPYTRKWDWSHAINVRESRSFNDQIYLRLADTYLLLAEAYFKNGDPGNAAFYINALRDRANATNITAGDITLDFILDERARELFSEEHRRYTLLRNDKWMERTNLYNTVAAGALTERDELYPIPQSFIDANIDNKVDNNPGYE